MLVHEIFHSIQGEGIKTGIPMTFIRLFGCNLSCSFCDTPQDRGQVEDLTIPEIVERVLKATPDRLILADAPKPKRSRYWTCITGGEPMIYNDLNNLIDAFHEVRYNVALETNGSVDRLPLPNADHICVSPKSGQVIDRPIVHRANEVKILIGAGLFDEEWMICRALNWHPNGEVCVQPLWLENQTEYLVNLMRAIELAQLYWIRLSVQVHKYIGVR